MKKMKYLVAISLVATIFAGNAGMALAQSSSTTNQALLNQIQVLLQQVKTLQNQMATLDAQRAGLKTQIQENLQLSRTLSLGMTSEEVKLLQEILATDPDIYPEGLVTGFFGPMTERAVKKFQAKNGIEQVGNVGPKTLARINELLTNGAGNSGKVPPGLLIAPGIAKKLGYNPTVPAGQNLPPGIAKKIGNNNGGNTTPDTTAPIITSLATTPAATTTVLSFVTNENTISTIWYASSTPVSTTTALKIVDNVFKTSHSYTISDLASSTIYHYLIEVKDVAGNKATTTENSFTTLAN